jgi:hypothetical protein
MTGYAEMGFDEKGVLLCLQFSCAPSNHRTPSHKRETPEP